MIELFDCSTINLKKGSKGEKVTLLQKHLKTLGFYTTYNGRYLSVDGNFGTYTELAVKAFQKKTNHSADGWFGSKTCKSLNELIQKNNATSSSTSSTSSTTTTSKTAGATYKDPYAVDTSKNIISQNESNISIDGLYFSATIISNTGFRKGNWKYKEMLDGSIKRYKAHRTPLEYTVEIVLSQDELHKLKNEFYKMSNRVCDVMSPHLESGKYIVDDINYATTIGTWKKVTIKLSEFQTR